MLAEIKEAITKKLLEQYPNSGVYDDPAKMSSREGSFLISVVRDYYNKVLDNRYCGLVLYDLSYYPLSINDRYSEFDTVEKSILNGFDMLDGFRIIEKKSSIVDDVLHIKFKVNYTEVKSSANIKMSNLEFEKNGG